MTPCTICGGQHDQRDWPEACWAAPERVRSPLACPMIRPDGMTIRTSDGHTFTSKADFQRHLAKTGLRPFEDGERTGPPPIKKTTDADLAPILKRHGVI